MFKKFLLSALCILILLIIAACAEPSNTTTTDEGNVFSSSVPSPISTDVNKAEVLLLVGGYGYEYGDVVLLDIQSMPKVGDVILFNWGKNESDFHAFGPQYQLVRVIALPDDNVIFERLSYKANGYEVILQSHKTPSTTHVIWGSEIYEDVSGLTLQIPEGEYLGDRIVGREGRQEDFGETDYLGYTRFTIKREAISGIVMKKIGHKNIPQITW